MTLRVALIFGTVQSHLEPSLANHLGGQVRQHSGVVRVAFYPGFKAGSEDTLREVPRILHSSSPSFT